MYISHLQRRLNETVYAVSSVFNALVLFCIRDINAAMQKMLNLKPNKDQNKYEDGTYPAPQSSTSKIHSLTHFFSSPPRLVLPSSSPRWQKNQIDIKMYLSGVVQACWLF